MKKRVVFPLIVAILVVSGSTVFALNNHSTPVKVQSVSRTVKNSTPIEAVTPQATPDAQATVTPAATTPVIQTPETSAPASVETVDSVIASAGWDAPSLACITSLRTLEPAYFANVAITKLTVAELKNYVTPCTVVHTNADGTISTTGFWTRSQYAIDQQG